MLVNTETEEVERIRSVNEPAESFSNLAVQESVSEEYIEARERWRSAHI